MESLYFRLLKLSQRFNIEWVRGFGWAVTHKPHLGCVFTIHALPERFAEAWQDIEDNPELVTQFTNPISR